MTYAEPRVMAKLERELAALDCGEVRFSRHDRALYSTDASIYQVEPLGVVTPTSVRGACEAIAACARRRVPMLARGGGTSLAGQCVNACVVLDFSPHLRRVLSVDPARREAVVEPGATIDQLNGVLAAHGLFFAPDPATASHACIGGVIANNAAGARSIRYGRTSENLREVEVAWWDGVRSRLAPGAGRSDPRVADATRRVAAIVRAHAGLIRERFPRTIRRNSGYALDLVLAQIDAVEARGAPDDEINLAPLIAGSEGTLAFVLGATLALHPLPAARSLTLVAFEGVDEAIERVASILETRPTAVELVDDVILDLARASVEYRSHVERLGLAGEGCRALLYVEHSAERDASELDEPVARLARVVAPRAIDSRRDPASIASAWSLRKAGEPLLHAASGHRRPLTFVEDNAVPVERLGEFVRGFRAIMARHGTRASFWAHASVGVLHVRPLLDPRDGSDRARARSIAVEVSDLARSLGGIMSGEHGDGRARTPLVERAFGSDLARAFREVRAVFDPHSLLNPGIITGRADVASITERLRVLPDEDRSIALAPLPARGGAFEHDLLHELERCNGAGLCRRTSNSGVMCPSYRATLDERHSTRGRANALRLAATGQLSDRAWGDMETLATLDLCLSCKACKGECPSGVDLARLRSEYLHQSHAERGVPLAHRATARAGELLGVASRAPGLANALARARPLREVLHRAGLIDRRRSIPRVERALERRWAACAGGPPDVLLFADCFTRPIDPSIALDARRVLESLGARVGLIAGACCGRSAISVGMLDVARSRVDESARAILAATSVLPSAPIIVCEPSCLSAFRDEWRSLRCATPSRARGAIADRVVSPTEFLLRSGRRPAIGGTGRVLLHPHCHERALGIDSDEAILREILGDRLVMSDAGCCGLAGAWGYATHRFDLSVSIARLSLAPSIERARGADASTTVLASGTSCRHQIRDVLGVEAIHPMRLLARSLVSG